MHKQCVIRGIPLDDYQKWKRIVATAPFQQPYRQTEVFVATIYFLDRTLLFERYRRIKEALAAYNRPYTFEMFTDDFVSIINLDKLVLEIIQKRGYPYKLEAF